MNTIQQILLYALLGFSCGQDFTADFTVTSPSMNSGFVRGTITYSWGNLGFILTYTQPGLTDLYVFNPSRGVTTYDGQYVFHTGSSCPSCETGVLDFVQPVLFFLPGMFLEVDSSFSTSSCVQYTPVVPSKRSSMVTRIGFSEDSQTLCSVTLYDGRHFKFSNVMSISTQVSDFAIPQGCTCSNPLDIALVMDRSGSIVVREFSYQYKFVQDFASKFSYSPTDTQLSIINFNTVSWLALSLSEGFSANAVNASINSLRCCAPGALTNIGQTTPGNSNPYVSCCAGRTSISTGIREATDQLATATRPKSAKAIVIVTDGYHNTPYNTSHDCYSACRMYIDGSDEFYKCIIDPVHAESRNLCLSDLEAAVQYATQKVNPSIFIIGVGFTSPEEFNIITSGRAEKQFTTADWTTVSELTMSITSRVCDENASPCGSCCGFCACGVCHSPDGCASQTPCYNSTLSGTCCQEVPITCSPPNACYTAQCTSDVCVPKPKDCPLDNPCYRYTCDPTSGACIQNFIGISADLCHIATCQTGTADPSTWKIVQVPKCPAGSDLCKNYSCNLATGSCITTNKTAPTTSNQCVKFYCDPPNSNVDIPNSPSIWVQSELSCPVIPCQIGSCNPTTGTCEYSRKICNDPSNICDISYCDSSIGPNGQCINRTLECDPTAPDGNLCRTFIGCDLRYGCQYSVPRTQCPSSGCDIEMCDPSTGDCVRTPTVGCNSICENSYCSEVSDICTICSCNISSSVVDNCEICVPAQDCSEAISSNTCVQNPRCDVEAGGCIYDEIQCTSEPPPCTQWIRNASHPGCCLAIPKKCGEDPCLNYTCDMHTGQCTSTPLCPKSDLCVTWTCMSGDCIRLDTICTSDNLCEIPNVCDPAVGCTTTSVSCDDNDACTSDACDGSAVSSPCVHKNITCDDGNPCTIDMCFMGACQFIPLICNDENACTIDSCDPTDTSDFGPCVFTPINATEICDDNNLCTTDYCDPIEFCVHSNVTCEDELNCTTTLCDPFQGCLFSVLECPSSGCNVSTCSEEEGGICVDSSLCVLPFTETALIIGGTLSAGVLAGIAIGIFACVSAACGGTVYGYANHKATKQPDGNINNNPLYKPLGSGGENALYRPQS